MSSKKPIFEYDTDFEFGVTYEGTVCGKILTERKNIKCLVVKFEDGRRTRVHRRSFLVSKSMPEFYNNGDTIKLTKIGFMGDRHLNKWLIEDSRRYNLSNPKAIQYFMDKKGWTKTKTKRSDKYIQLALGMHRPFAKALQELAEDFKDDQED